MPIDYNLYPKDWKTHIRPRILQRARHRCEQCGLPNHCTALSKSRVQLLEPQPYKTALANVGWYHEPEDRAIVIVLTIAHLDHDTTNNADTNLAALCQRCHLTHDKEHHATSARSNRAKRSNQLSLAL